jgi:hypothetical protein
MYSDIEYMIGAIKFDPDLVNLDDVRALLRRCQDYILTLEELLETSTVPGTQVLHALRNCRAE